MRAPRLRNTLAAITIALIGGALALAGALIVTTTRLERTSDDLAARIESVRIAQQSMIELLLLHSTKDPLLTGEHAASLRAELGRARGYVRSSVEAAALDEAVVRTERYLGAATRDEALHANAYAALAELVTINVRDARDARIRAQQWNRQADRVGMFAIAALLLAAVGLTWWLRRALAPLLALSRTFERYAAGDRMVRAVEDGHVEVRQMAEQFNLMVSTLRDQSSARSTLLRSVAHDLRTPLGALRLSVDVLATHDPAPPPAQLRRGLERIGRQIDRFDRLVADLSELAQVEAGELRLQLERCDAVAIVRDVVGLYEAQASEHPIVVTSADEQVAVQADPWRLEQVVGNLLTNAMKYSPRHAPVSVSIEASPEAATIAIGDRGAGIRPEDRTRLFEPYWRGEVGDTPGTGLGLFITRRIVEAHGGTIDVGERPEGGSIFRVRLPIYGSASRATGATTSVAAAESSRK